MTCHIEATRRHQWSRSIRCSGEGQAADLSQKHDHASNGMTAARRAHTRSKNPDVMQVRCHRPIGGKVWEAPKKAKGAIVGFITAHMHMQRNTTTCGQGCRSRTLFSRPPKAGVRQCDWILAQSMRATNMRPHVYDLTLLAMRRCPFFLLTTLRLQWRTDPAAAMLLHFIQALSVARVQPTTHATAAFTGALQ